MATREAIMNALLAKLAATAEYVLVSRRNRAPETITPALSPALFLFEDAEHYRREGPSRAPVRSLIAKAVIYNNVGPNSNMVPATVVNNALDALDAALVADNAALNTCTLGGLVNGVLIDGEVVKAPGDVTGVALAIVPIRILMP